MIYHCVFGQVLLLIMWKKRHFMKVYMISDLKMVLKKIKKRFPYDGEPILNLILMVLTLQLYFFDTLAYVLYINVTGVRPPYSLWEQKSNFLKMNMTSDLKMIHSLSLKWFHEPFLNHFFMCFKVIGDIQIRIFKIWLYFWDESLALRGGPHAFI